VLDHLNSAMREFITGQEMMFVGTADRNGNADASFRAGHPSFVKVLDQRTIAYPESPQGDPHHQLAGTVVWRGAPAHQGGSQLSASGQR
jgi:predicted pyridoxine 5'-phosphate oxidase superfamily flavin-nucleotide-binding protein